MHIAWSPQSLRDLDAIHEYIAKDSERYADLTVSRIFAAVERLPQFPHSGRIVPERHQSEIREIIVGRFRVVYRIRGAMRLQLSSGRRENSRRNCEPRQLSGSALPHASLPTLWPGSRSSKPRHG